MKLLAESRREPYRAACERRRCTNDVRAQLLPLNIG